MLFRNLFPYKRNEAKNYVVSKAMRRSPRARSSKPEPKTLVEQLEEQPEGGFCWMPRKWLRCA
jgi:hypothetical protein